MREYKNDDLIVYWFPETCAHPGTCLRMLPEVFDLDRRPWVDINAAEPEEIIRCIECCPSGALRYALPEGSKVDPALAEGVNHIDYEKHNPGLVKIRAMKRGPLLVEGAADIIRPDGQLIKSGGRLALCGCGKSENCPFCDGSHFRSRAGGNK